MLRLALFFLAALVLTGLLRQVPFIGGFFDIPLLGFWLTAVLLAGCIALVAERLVGARRLRNRVRDLGVVDRPANQGKLGALLLSHGRVRAAAPHLEAAHRGEPERMEWSYRLGEARLQLGDAEGALAVLDPLVARDEEHAYGRALLLSARAARMAGRSEDSLARVARLERVLGPSAEAAFERGHALRALGRTGEARAAFRDVPRLAAQAGRFHRTTSRSLVWRARLAQLR